LYLSRILSGIIIESIESFPGITLTCPRQSGKKTLVKYLSPDAEYHTLENPVTWEKYGCKHFRQAKLFNWYSLFTRKSTSD